jgi:hypothetical protein
MTDLSPTARDALAALRARDALDPAARSRLRARIDTSIAAGDGGSAPLDTRAIAIRIALPVAIAAAVLLALWAIAPRRGATRADRGVEGQAAYGAAPRGGDSAEAATRQGASVRDDEAPEDVPVDREGLPPTNASTEPIATSTAAHADRPARTAARAPGDRDSHRAEAPSAATDTTLAEEMRLLRRARAAMRDHDPARALTALQAHAESFSDGQMSEDRDALRVEALCAADRRDDARAAAAAFARAWPRSPHGARVQKICTDP